MKNHLIKSSAKSALLALSAASVFAGLPNIAAAQNNEQGAANQSTIEEITVTGSRIRRTTDFETPNPTTVVDSDYLDKLGIVNIGDAISQLPSNVSNFTPDTTGNSNFFAGSTIANLRGLNPFFGSRTLTLINNRRFVPTNQGDGVDLNFIPSVLIDHIDSVTGGASAAYGSGAISGVQNIFLNRRLEGGKVNVDYYQTGDGDGNDKHVGLAYGTRLMDDRASLVVGYEYQSTDAIDCLDRDWCRKGYGFIAGNPGGPSNILASNVRKNQMSYTGVLNTLPPFAPPATTTTLQANADGTALVPFNIGQGSAGSPFNSVIGGDGIPIYEETNLRAPLDRDVFTGLFNYALTDTMNMSIDVSWGKVETTNVTAALDDSLDFIQPDNAYIALNPGLAGAAFNLLNKDWTSQIDSHSVFTTEVKRAALGFEGEIGSTSWTWSAYYQYGKSEREQLVADNRHLNAYLMAVDSVIDPGTGQPVCRVTRDGFATAILSSPSYALADPQIANGCVPINPFGNQPIPQDAKAYAFGFLRENLDYTQDVLAFDLSGDLSDGIGAGPFQLAVGGEYRKEEGHNIGSQNGAPDYVRTDYLIQYGESFSGKVEVSEAFAELNLPLVSGQPGAEFLSLNTAVRQSHYKNTGLAGTTGETRSHNFTTWKVSGIYDPTEWMRIRASRSRDLRAANFRELYYGQIIHAGGTFGFCGPANSFTDPCDWSLEGNVDLDPEKADTTTIGVVLTPTGKLEGLQFAADYFKIEIEDAIQQANVRRVLDGCQISGIQEFCDLLVPDVPGDYTMINNLRALSFNGSGYSYKGMDLSANYVFELQNEDMLSFRFLATRMFEQEFQPTPGQPFVDVVGQTGTSNSFLSDYQPTAEWTGNLSATYTHGPLNITGQVRYVSSGEMNYYGITPSDSGYATATAPLVTMDDNSVDSYSVFALSGSYDIDAGGFNTQIFLAIDNLFDKDPPVAPGTGFGGNANGGTNPVFFDAVGRAARVGLRMTF